MVFKEPSFSGEAPISNEAELKEKKVFITLKERVAIAETTWINSMPASSLDLSNAVRGELESFVEKNLSGKRLEDVSIGEIIKNFDKLENSWKKNYFLELEAEITHWKNLMREFLDKNKN